MKGPMFMGLIALALFAVPSQGQKDEAVSKGALDGQEDAATPDEACDVDVGRLLKYLLEDADNHERARKNLDATTHPKMTPVTDQSEVDKRNHLMDSFLTLLRDTIRQYQNPMKIYMKKSGVLVMRPAKRAAIGKRRKNIKRKRERLMNRRKREKREISTKAPMEAWEHGGFGLDVIYDDENEEGRLFEDEYDDYIDEESSYHDEIDEKIDHENELAKTSVSNENNQDNETEMEGSHSAKEQEPDLEEGRDLFSTSRQAKRKKNRRRKGGNGKCNKRCKRRRINRRRRRRKNRQQVARNGQQTKRTGPKAIASVSGMFNLRRTGDVRISKGDEQENIAADIEVGPIVLQAQKMAQTETAKSFREAKAKTSVIKGRLVLNLSPDGIALKELNLIKPDVIQVTGSFAPKSGGTSGSFMRTYITKTQPLIVDKMKRAANRVLKLSQGNIDFFKSQGA